MNHFSLQTIETLNAVDLWLEINPFLTITTRNRNRKLVGEEVEVGPNDKKLELKNMGFCRKDFITADADGKKENLLKRVTRGINNLLVLGYHPNWILCYDEPWLVQDEIVTQMEHVSTNKTIGDWFFFKVHDQVDPKDSTCSSKSSSYLAPYHEEYVPGPAHRDRPSPTNSFSPDGHPLYCSVWLALTEATIENSCLHFLEKSLDPGYMNEGDALPTDLSILDTQGTAQECKIGEYLVFSHRLLHWASPLPLKRSSTPQPNPHVDRIALTFALADPSFEADYLADTTIISTETGADQPTMQTLPPLSQRIGLLCGQMIQYNHLLGENISRHTISLYRRLFIHAARRYKEGGGFSKAHVEKIMVVAQFLLFMKGKGN